MNFRPELAAKVMAGEKTVTRRIAVEDKVRSPWWIGGCSLRVNKPGGYAVCPGRGKPAIGRVRLTAPPVLRVLGHLSDAEARAEGFDGALAFEAAFAGINGAYVPETPVWVVAFEVIR